MDEIKKLKEDIKEARKKVYEDFESDRTEDARKNVDAISRLEIECQKMEDDLRLREEEAEFNYEQAEKDEARKQERHEAEMEKIRLETDLAKKKFRADIIKDGFEAACGAGGLFASYKITTGVIKYNKEKPFPVDRTSLDVAKRFFDQASRGFGRLRFKK